MPNFVGDALYAHAKGGCYRCLRGDSLVDLDTLIEGEGALVLCTDCIREAAEAADLHLNIAAVAEERAAFAEERRSFSPDRVAELEAELAEAYATLVTEQAVVDRLMGKSEPEAPAPKARTK